MCVTCHCPLSSLQGLNQFLHLLQLCVSFLFSLSSSLFALGNTMSGLISFSNHWRLQGKDFWLGCFVPANTKERGEKIITLVVDNSCSDHSAVICLWCSLWLQLMLSLFCYCPLQGATPLLQAVRCSSSLPCPSEIYSTPSGCYYKGTNKKVRCSVRREKSVGYVLFKGKTGCRNARLFKEVQIQRKLIIQELREKSLES